MDPNPHTVRSATLGAGWALGVLTIPAFLLIMFRAKLSLGKVFLLSTCIISFALLILSTWAIRHEGAGKHSADLNSGSFTTLAKVRTPFYNYITNAHTLVVGCSRSTLVLCERFSATCGSGRAIALIIRVQGPRNPIFRRWYSSHFYTLRCSDNFRSASV
jgi:hypothetical protein